MGFSCTSLSERKKTKVVCLLLCQQIVLLKHPQLLNSLCRLTYNAKSRWRFHHPGEFFHHIFHKSYPSMIENWLIPIKPIESMSRFFLLITFTLMTMSLTSGGPLGSPMQAKKFCGQDLTKALDQVCVHFPTSFSSGHYSNSSACFIFIVAKFATLMWSNN